MKPKSKFLLLPGLMLFLAFNSCTKNTTNTDLNASAGMNAGTDQTPNLPSESTENNSRVLYGYPTYLLSTPLISSELPPSVINAQTPIDISTSNSVKFFSSSPEVHYGNITLNNVVNNEGENLKINLSAADMAKNYVIIAGKKYTLNQFHFHYHSEHTINGHYKEMEIHFVNIAADNSYAVLGVFVESGNYNKDLQTLFNASPHVPDGVNSLTTQFNVDHLFPDNTSLYFTYSGSLTTPNFGANSSVPNGGPVTWIVYKNSTRLSHAQLEAYEEIYEEANFRNIQPLNGRIVFEHISQ
jgi:carbonic anhydrase